MEEINMNSCSFSSYDDDKESQQSWNVVDEERMSADKAHLTDVNKQLQSTVDTLRQQLRDAMEVAESINGMNETINQLKDQLYESHVNEKNLTKELNSITKEKEENDAKYAKESEANKAKIDSIEKVIAEEKEKYNKLKKERKALKQELDSKTRDVENVAIELKEAKSAKKKLRSKFVQVVEKMQYLEKENQDINLKLQEETNEKDSYAQEIDSLKIKLSSAIALKEESNSEVDKLNDQLKRNEKLIKSFESQFEQQRTEMEEINDERQKALLLVQQIHGALSIAENKIDSITKENVSLNTKLDKIIKKGKVNTSFDVQELNMPFEGDMGQKADYFMKLPQYNLTQRIQLVVNEAAKRLREAEETAETKEREIVMINNELEQAVSGQTPFCQILDSLLKELKNISCQEAQINNANLCRVDTQFIEFMAEKSAEIEPLIRDDLLKDPRFIPSDFFTTPDVSKKLECVKDLLATSDMAYSIFTAQFITNQLLTNQLNALMGPLGKMEEISRLDVVGGDFNDIPNLLKSLQNKISSLKKTRTQLHALLKQEKDRANDMSKAQHELKTLASQLQIKNDALESEIDVLKVKYQVASNQLLLKNNEENLNEFANQIREDVDLKQNEARQTTIRLEEELEKKTKECSELSDLIKKLQKTIEESARKANKKYQRNEEAYVEQISNMQQQIEMLEKQVVHNKKAAKRNERSLREQYDSSIKDVTKHFEESKGNLQKTIDDLKEKMIEAREMTKKAQQDLHTSEEKNNKIMSQNSDLTIEKKSLDAQLMGLKQQIQKDKQQLQIQIAAQMMACETKIQKSTQEVKEAAEKHLKELLDNVNESLGAFYNIDDEMNEEIFKQLISHVKDDLEKLRYFQTEATDIKM